MITFNLISASVFYLSIWIQCEQLQSDLAPDPRLYVFSALRRRQEVYA